MPNASPQQQIAALPSSAKNPPPHRRLRVYTFDPSLATQLDTVLINETVLRVPWEKLRPGPVGEYLEVVDYDPASRCFYNPVDLENPYLLAQDGLTPTEGNPQFHQQMVYAVAMTTIHNFERALGRRALWAPHIEHDPETGEFRSSELVSRLRIYPHALREANAYYSPQKKALLFGYFPAILVSPGENLPGGMVFTCLSHDVVAHETTHALLDGLHRYFGEPTNPDVLAFHEAFADIVALFQHFTQPEALRDQIVRTHGDLGRQNLLGELAHQFGQAIGNHGALRDAIGKPDPVTGQWKPQVPNPELYPVTTEPHARGALLVAAMFDGFLSVYKGRIADLLRIAADGTGELPAGSLHPDLVKRLACEATDTAAYVLRMAIRALDYCPPVDITFGEYLRALITGDSELAPDDPHGYRIAVIEAFRRRGIYPRDVRTLAWDALLWQKPTDHLPDFADLIHKLKSGWMPESMPGFKPPARGKEPPTLEWQTTASREQIDRLNHRYQYATWAWFKEQAANSGKRRNGFLPDAIGLALGADAPATIYRSKLDGLPALEIHSVRSARRPLQDGRTILDLVIEMTQSRRGYLDPEKQKRADKLPPDSPQWKTPELRPDFKFRGGCTLLIDSEKGELRYCIVKSIRSESRLARQRAFVSGAAEPSLRATYTRLTPGSPIHEPFALLHRSH
ncbi:MAG TPA: hypothetical protein VMG10_10860 [Gemmataceae bacterium]|nr:hypothetical protein [Gemmataceae bacterium]